MRRVIRVLKYVSSSISVLHRRLFKKKSRNKIVGRNEKKKLSKLKIHIHVPDNHHFAFFVCP